MPVEQLLQTPNFARASLMELAVVADAYGQILRLRGSPFLPADTDMRKARKAYAATVEKDRNRYEALCALLEEQDRDGLNLAALARRHGRSARNLRLALAAHEELRAFQAAHPLPEGRTHPHDLDRI